MSLLLSNFLAPPLSKILLTLVVVSDIADPQYLNYKILHGGTLLHPWPNVSGNYVIPSLQLKCFFPETSWRPKKGLRRKLKCFFLKSSEEQKKGLHRNLGLYSAGICRIHSCWLALDLFIIQRSNLDEWTSKPRWGDAKSRWGDVNSWWGGASPRVLPII